MAIDFTPEEPAAGGKIDFTPVQEEGTISKFLNKKLPITPAISEGLHGAAEKLQQAAGNISEEAGRLGAPKSVATALGAPSALASTETQFASEMVPVTRKDLLIMGVTEGVGGMAKEGLRFLQEPAVNRELAPVARRAIAAAAELNVPLTLAQIRNSKSWAMVEKMLGRIPGSADILASFHEKQSEALTKAKTDLLDKLGPAPSDFSIGRKVAEQAGGKISSQESARSADYSAERSKITSKLPAPELPEARGAAMIKAKEHREDVAKAVRSTLYSWAEDALPDKKTARLTDAPIRSELEAIAKTYPDGSPQRLFKNKINNIIGTEAADVAGNPLKQMDPKIVQMLKDKPELLSQAPPEIQAAIKNQGSYSFKQLDNVVKRLGDAAEKERFPEGPRGKGDYTTEGRQLLLLKKAASGIRDDFFASQGGEAQQRHEIARAFHADFAETYRNKEIQSLYKEDPVKVFQGAVKSGRPETVQTLSKALGPNGTTILKRQLFDDVFSADGAIPKQVDVLDRMNKYGPALRVLFTPAEQQQWRDFALAGEAPKFLQTEYERAVRSVLTHEPQEIPKYVLNGDVLTARAIKRYVSPEVFKEFGSKLAQKIMTPAGDAEFGNVGINARLGKYEDNYLKTFFDDKTLRGMKNIGEASRLLPGYGDLGNRPTNGQDSALMYGMMGAIINPKRALTSLPTLIIASSGLAKMYTTEAGQRILTTLMRMPATDPRLPQVIGRLAEAGYLHTVHQKVAQ